jgi:ABC-2 type transport system ATP-binding protein
LLLSLCRPTEGDVFRFDRPAEERRTLARVGYVHEAPAFPRDLSAAGLLDYYGTLSLVPRAELRRRIPLLLERVGLADRAREPIGRFSKGMVQRLGLAQALINEPDLLVLDEPTEGLDVSGRELVREVVAERRAQGGTVVLISHALAEVERLCDRAVILNEGRVVHDGPLADLGRDPATGAPRTLEQAWKDLVRRTAG